MNIQGLQKLTLLDYPGHLAATIFTGGCNFRCPYCHNWSLVEGYFPPESVDEYVLRSNPLKAVRAGGKVGVEVASQVAEAVRETVFPVAEILGFLHGRKGKLQGVCITGGEPLLHEDLPDFIAEIRRLGLKVKLDTNGSMPNRLAAVLERNLLNYVAMDIKNCPRKYAITAGLKGGSVVEAVEKSKELLSAHLQDWELRTTVVRQFHTVEDMDSIGEWMAGPHKFFLQNFRPGEGVPSSDLSPVGKEELDTFLAALRRHLPSAEIRGD